MSHTYPDQEDDALAAEAMAQAIAQSASLLAAIVEADVEPDYDQTIALAHAHAAFAQAIASRELIKVMLMLLTDDDLDKTKEG